MGTKVNLDVNLLPRDRILVAGSARYVILLPENAASYMASVDSVASQIRDAGHAQLLVVLQAIADNMQPKLPKTSFNHEGDGIFAAKANCGLRAWGWYGDAKRDTVRQPVFAISFVTLKKSQKADPADLKFAKNHRTEYDK